MPNTSSSQQTTRQSVGRGRSANQSPKLNDVAHDSLQLFQDYAKERPEVVALWCLGIGFVLGWKLKPW